MQIINAIHRKIKLKIYCQNRYILLLSTWSYLIYFLFFILSKYYRVINPIHY